MRWGAGLDHGARAEEAEGSAYSRASGRSWSRTRASTHGLKGRPASSPTAHLGRTASSAGERRQQQDLQRLRDDMTESLRVRLEYMLVCQPTRPDLSLSVTDPSHDADDGCRRHAELVRASTEQFRTPQLPGSDSSASSRSQMKSRQGESTPCMDALHRLSSAPLYEGAAPDEPSTLPFTPGGAGQTAVKNGRILLQISMHSPGGPRWTCSGLCALSDSRAHMVCSRWLCTTIIAASMRVVDKVARHSKRPMVGDVYDGT